MNTISREDLLKIAKLSNLELQEEEIPALLIHISAVLSYASRVQEAVALETKTTEFVGFTNVTRTDTVIAPQAQSIRTCFPKEEQNFIVVPHILEGN